MNYETALILAVAIVVVLVGLRWLVKSFPKHIVYEYDWALLFKNGRFVRVLDSGAHRIWAVGAGVVKFDKRNTQIVVGGQEILTKDNIGIKISAVVETKIVDPVALVRTADNQMLRIHLDVQLALRQAAGEATLEELLEDQNSVVAKAESAVRQATAGYGVELVALSLRDIMLSKEIRSAYAAELSARLEGQVALSKAEYETAALRKLANTARMLKDNPELFQLRVLQTLSEKSDNQRTVVLDLGSNLKSGKMAATDTSGA